MRMNENHNQKKMIQLQTRKIHPIIIIPNNNNGNNNSNFGFTTTTTTTRIDQRQ